jgi:LYR motif-containing protein 4
LDIIYSWLSTTLISSLLFCFSKIQYEKDPAKVSAFYQDAVKELAVMKRSAIVNQLYGGWRLVVEKQKAERQRGVN